MALPNASQKDLTRLGMWPAQADQVVGLGKVKLNVRLDANSVSDTLFIADRAYTVESIKEVHSVVGGSGANVKIRRITDTSAPGAAASATVVEYVTSGIDLTTTVNTVQTPTLVTGSTVTLAAGERLCKLMAGTLTGLVGMVTIVLVPA